MNILRIGTGMQGKAALYDLAASPAVSRAVAADRDLVGLQAYVRTRPVTRWSAPGSTHAIQPWSIA